MNLIDTIQLKNASNNEVINMVNVASLSNGKSLLRLPQKVKPELMNEESLAFYESGLSFHPNILQHFKFKTNVTKNTKSV